MSLSQVIRLPRNQTITIASGSTVSGVADIRKSDVFGFIGSTAFDSSTLTFRVGASSSSDASFFDLYLANTTQVTLTVTTNAARAYLLNISPNVLAPWPYLVLVSGSTGETAGRTWTILSK